MLKALAVSELYPLQFEPYFKEFIWGGRRLETLNKRLPPGKTIGEAWEIWDADVVRNGPLKGATLAELTRQFGPQLLGTRVPATSHFPLILKLSTTELDLSVQVHPDDAQAARLEPASGFTGKREMIYILEAQPGARVFFGFKEPTDARALQAEADAGEALVRRLNQVRVAAGDVFFVPPGTVHAYGAGLTYFELQQNSDLTYRLFDWHRVGADGKPRELHIAKARAVINFDTITQPKIQPIVLEESYGRRAFLTACEKFLVERFELASRRALRVVQSAASFHILCVIAGSAMLHAAARAENELALKLGDVILLPATVAEYRLTPTPNCQVLRSSVPDLKREVVDFLLARGVAAQRIAENVKREM